MAVVNLVLVICFGLLALNEAYAYYNNVYVNYMKEQLKQEVNNDNGRRQATEELAGTSREE